MDLPHLNEIRRTELLQTADWFGPGMRVLEIGGGNGYQAGLLADRGCVVTSVDLATHPCRGKYFPVMAYDGVQLPFQDQVFDRVFSSNTLEHIEHLPRLLLETQRVLKREGLAIHIVPSSSWRFWTNLAHYAFLAKKLGSSAKASYGQTGKLMQDKGRWHVLRSILIPGGHGVDGNALTELHRFSRRSWRLLLEKAGFECIEVKSNNLFYTGYGLIPELPLCIRHGLARCLGGSCHILLLRSLA